MAASFTAAAIFDAVALIVVAVAIRLRQPAAGAHQVPAKAAPAELAPTELAPAERVAAEFLAAELLPAEESQAEVF